MDTYKGSGVSPGIGLGKFYVINNEIDFSIPKKLSFKESQSKLDMRYEQLISKLEAVSYTHLTLPTILLV